MTDSVKNIATVAGIFDSTSATLNSNSIITPMTNDLAIVKEADQDMWATGELTYTVTVSNTSATLPYEDVIFTDILDPTKIALVTDSVKIDDVTTVYTYDEITGTLVVTAGNIAASTDLVITFKVVKK